MAIEYEDTLYCNIEGKLDRIPLKLIGKGLGPKIKFSFTNLNIGNVFIFSKHKYELVLSNDECINSSFKFQINPGKFSECFTFVPTEGFIYSKGYQLIKIIFCSNKLLGYFNETIEFILDGCEKKETITFE